MNEPTQAKNQPIAAWKTRSLDVTVWERKNEVGAFYSVKAVHRFKRDLDQRWDETSSFDYADIPMLRELLDRAFSVALKAAVDARMERMRYPDQRQPEHKPAVG